MSNGWPLDKDCISCKQESIQHPDEDFCPQTRRKCKHHCNHSWTHDECCWCGKTWGEEK